MAKILYSAPLKALSQEKYEDWTKLFPDKKILQLTGDTLTSQKVRMEMMKAAETADILIMTAELLDSVTRNHYSEHYQWVKHVQLLVVDEAHCFPGSTMVRISPTCEVPIKQIVEDETITEVVSYNETTATLETKKILTKFQKPTFFEGRLVKINYTVNGEKHSLVCTANHKIWTDEGYIEARNLKSGAKIKQFAPLPKTARKHNSKVDCFLCDEKFDTIKAFKQHCLNVHQCSALHVCEICGSGFKNRNFLGRHGLEKHQKEKHENWITNIKKSRKTIDWKALTKKAVHSNTERGHYAKMSEDRKGANNPLFKNNNQGLNKMTEKARERWNDLPQDQKEAQITRFMQAPKYRKDRITSLEQKIIDLNIPEIRYTGNGTFWLTFSNGKHKNPDFKVTGQRKVIEIGDFEHWHNHAEAFQTGLRYNEIDYKCLYLHHNDVEADKIEQTKQRILTFISNHEAVVTSVADYYHARIKNVYTLEIEDNHNYIANNVLVANCVTMTGRGHVIEASIMRFCEIAPQAKVWFMSATMPNCEEFAQWLTTLNRKPSEIINSTWRPTELRWNFIPHNAFGSYWENQDDKIRKAVEIIEEHQNESTLVFVHDKNTGRRIDAVLKDLGIACEFYNADLDTETRHDLLKRFESEDNNRIAALISTSALAWGVNTSAQNAVIVGVHRGIQPVDELDILQAAGRAGRFGKTPYGNVYLICDNIPEWKEKVAHPRDVTSTLLDTYALAFHLCAEIKNKVIKDYDTMYTWYHRTLASIQSPLEKQHVDEVLTALQNWKAVVINPDDTFSITALGTVAATLYFHPEDVHHWWQCFSHIERQGLWKNDLCIAYALSAPSMQLPYIPRSEEPTVQTYFNALRQVWRNGPFLKQSTLSRDVHDLLCGDKATPQSRPLQSDAERIVGAISWIMGIAKMGMPDMLKVLPTRLKYGVSAELCALVQLPGIGGVRAKKLAAMGITTWADVVRNPDKIQRVIGEKNVKKVVDSARNLLRVHATETE